MPDKQKPEPKDEDDATELIDREALLRRARAQAEEEEAEEQKSD